MKKLKYIILFAGLFACSNLEEEVFSEIAPSNFYQNADQANAAVVSIYNTYSRAVGLFDFGLASMVVMPSPYMQARVPWRRNWGNYTVAASDPISIPRTWNSLYQGIFRANVVIAELETRDFGDELENETRDFLIGEAKFLRAWSYFNLVRLFGDVPMPLLPATSVDQAILGRTSSTNIYEQIIIDLQDAESNLPADKRTGIDLGRPFSTTATFLLAKVYLTMAGLPLQDASKMALAQSKLQEVINLEGSSQGYSLLDSYEDAIRIENNDERIFAIQQTQAVEDQGTAFSHVWGGRFRFNGTGQFHGGYSQTFYDAFESFDLRRDVTMAYSYPDARNGNMLTFGTAPYNARFGIAQNKYVDFDQTAVDGDPDMILFRYSDALLMAAEIENDINGPTPTAYMYLNRVRARAEASDAPSGMTQDEFIDYIYEERFKELSFEFHEVFDMRRLGKVEEALARHPENITYAPTNTAYQSHFELWPIPLAEINANPNLEQTTGW